MWNRKRSTETVAKYRQYGIEKVELRGLIKSHFRVCFSKYTCSNMHDLEV